MFIDASFTLGKYEGYCVDLIEELKVGKSKQQWTILILHHHHTVVERLWWVLIMNFTKRLTRNSEAWVRWVKCSIMLSWYELTMMLTPNKGITNNKSQCTPKCWSTFAFHFIAFYSLKQYSYYFQFQTS